MPFASAVRERRVDLGHELRLGGCSPAPWLDELLLEDLRVADFAEQAAQPFEFGTKCAGLVPVEKRAEGLEVGTKPPGRDSRSMDELGVLSGSTPGSLISSCRALAPIIDDRNCDTVASSPSRSGVESNDG